MLWQAEPARLGRRSRAQWLGCGSDGSGFRQWISAVDFGSELQQ
jgi:hypothetical protein